MIEILLCEWLRDHAPITNIVPNIYAIALPSSQLYPSLRITCLNSHLESDYDGITGEEDAIIQIDYWAKSSELIGKIKPLMSTFVDQLPTNHACISGVHSLREQPSFEPKERTFKRTLEFTISYKDN